MREPEIFAEGDLATGVAGDGGLRWAAADLTAIRRAAALRLDLSPISAAALGRSLSAAALLLRMAAKTPQRLTLEIHGDGPIRRILAEADAGGNLRGMVGDPRVDLPARPDGKLPVGRAVGSGMLRVARELARGTFRSQVELVTGEIGDDVAHYLEQSEQVRSAVLLGVLGRRQGVAGAGGLIVERLPGCPDEVLARLEANLAEFRGISYLLEEGGLAVALDRVFAGLDRERLEERPLAYRCRCDRDRLERHLATLPDAERRELAEEDGSLVADCLFCGTAYRFDLDALTRAG